MGGICNCGKSSAEALLFVQWRALRHGGTSASSYEWCNRGAASACCKRGPSCSCDGSCAGSQFRGSASASCRVKWSTTSADFRAEAESGCSCQEEQGMLLIRKKERWCKEH